MASEVVNFNFGLKGMVTKGDPALLGDGEYRSASGVQVIQEGSLSTESGRKLLGAMTGTALIAYMIRKMSMVYGEDPLVPASNPRYIGALNLGHYDIWRTLDYSSFTKVAADVNTTAGIGTKRFAVAPYSAGGSGSWWAFIASELKMLKDSGSAPYNPLRRWGILPAYGVAIAVDSGAGLLDGGDSASPNGSQRYDYRYTYIGNDTNNEGNPSQTMRVGSTAGAVRGDGTYTGSPIAVHNRQVTVTVWGTDDPQVSEIAIYRRGGILFDAWRLVGRITNPGIGLSNTFVDGIPDADLVEGSPSLVLDNDPPVVSTVPQPITASTTGAVAVGFQTVTVTPAQLAKLTPGSTLHFFYDNPEDVTVQAVIGSNQFTAYFQFPHSSGADIEVDAITGQPCHLAMTFGDCIILAGDPNNPHLLYKTKIGSPEACPASPSDGTVAISACGSPSNPIIGICEFRGQILTINTDGLFEAFVSYGNLTQGVRVANKIMLGCFAWCKGEQEIWCLCSDGVYTWDGAQFIDRTESIKPIFRGKQVNGIPPLSKTPQFLASACMEIRSSGEVMLSYVNNVGTYTLLVCEPKNGYRWRLSSESGGSAITYLYTEPDTGSTIEVRSAPMPTFAIMDQVVVSGGVNYTSLDYTTDPTTQGTPVPFEILLPWFQLGNAQVQKLYLEAMLDLDSSGSTGASSLQVDMYVDFATVATETFTIPATAKRTLVSILPKIQTLGGDQASTGIEARAVTWRIRGLAYPTMMQFFSLIMKYQPTGVLTGGASEDWMDLGYKWDKKLYQMTVVYDVHGPVSKVLVLDTISGVGGSSVTLSRQKFTVTNPASAGSSRGQQAFPIAPGTIVKAVRLRVVTTTAAGSVVAEADQFKILDVEFAKEDFPPDIVSMTAREDGGYAFDKYANQISVEVDTGGFPVDFWVQSDGVNFGVAHTVTTTEGDRRRNITLPKGAPGRKWNLYCDPSQAKLNQTNFPGSKFQLFDHKFAFQPADRGEVGHTFDWDDLGHPWDKLLRTATLEWDLTGSASTVVMRLDTISGIGGQTVTPNVANFTLNGGRGKKVFTLPPDTIAKMIQLYPVGTPPEVFKTWKYLFDKIDYPADNVQLTEWRDAQGINDVNPSWVWINADTQSIVSTVRLMNESGSVILINHTGSVTDRKRHYPVPADVTGKMWRLLPSSGVNGKFQLFGWGFERWHPYDQAGPEDPPDVVLWTPWNDFGYPYDKVARNFFAVVDTGGAVVPVQLQTQENGTVQTFQVQTSYTNRRIAVPCSANLIGKQWRLYIDPNQLPVGAKFKLWDWGLEALREPAAVTFWDSYEQNFGTPFFKFLKQGWWCFTGASPITITFFSETGNTAVVLPASAARGEFRFPFFTKFGAGLNKSKIYRITIASATPFKFYPGATMIEMLVFGSDRHGAYVKASLSEMMGIQEVGA